MPNKSKQLPVLTTFDEVVHQLGGTSEVGRICERSPQSVVGARNRGFFPTVWWPPIIKALNKKGFSADPGLFRFEQDVA